MAQPVIQTSFHSGEWAPALNARVDLAKYHAAAATMRNFFVDYRGGASSRTGTQYILRCYDSSKAVRLIPFQASFTVTYILEFGDFYIRFFNNGAPVLESTIAITNAVGNVFTAANSYGVGDWVFIDGVGGITNVNGKYFIVSAATATDFTVTDLYGNAVTFAGSYTSGGTAARVYTLPSPYAAADLANLKFSQNVSSLIICNSNYVPYVLTLISAADWTITPIVFGATVSSPTGLALTQTGVGTGGGWFYSYIVTAVDSNGQESPVSAAVTNSSSWNDLRTASNATITLSWAAVSGAASYNIYKAEQSQVSVPVGAAYGFIGNATGTSLADSNISPDFTQGPPVAQNPFGGAPVASITVTANGSYTTVPSVTIGAAPAGFQTAIGQVVLQIISIDSIPSGGSGYASGDLITFGTGSQAFTLVVNETGTGNKVSSFYSLNHAGTDRGNLTSGSTPSNPVSQSSTTGSGTGCTVSVTWGVRIVNILDGGGGYLTAPTVTFSAGLAAATAVLGAVSSSNPSVVGFFQQRMVLANLPRAVQTFYMSQPGTYYNYNISNPLNADNAISGSIVAAQLNDIKSVTTVPTGMLVLTSRAAWLVNGGSSGSAITPLNAQANSHSFIGAADLPPIVANFDVLFVQDKGSVVRDLSYNFYAQIFTGTDISVLSSHLFYGYTLKEWTWSEEPFKTVWIVRSDGVMLTLTFLKEQELIGWARHDTTNGLYKSVASVTETVALGSVDAVYTVVERTINGQTVKYIERFTERYYPNGVSDAWSVDAGLQYNGSPATVISGLDHLIGQSVTGLADGAVIPAQTVASDGSITLGTAASKVTIGLGFTAQLQTLRLDLGEPTVQGKRKKITAVTVRVKETLGLSIGKSFSSLVPMKDLVVGNVGSASNQIVADLVTDDARTIIDPSWTVDGQYCIEQSNPLPASILGVIPEVVVGDTK